MGDRRQVKFEPVNIWFYTHWGGYTLGKDLKEAIEFAKERWSDESYLFRILVSRLTKDDIERTTGTGLWNASMDSEYNDFTVDLKNKTVELSDKKWSFEEFVELDNDVLERLG